MHTETFSRMHSTTILSRGYWLTASVPTYALLLCFSFLHRLEWDGIWRLMMMARLSGMQIQKGKQISPLSLSFSRTPWHIAKGVPAYCDFSAYYCITLYVNHKSSIASSCSCMAGLRDAALLSLCPDLSGPKMTFVNPRGVSCYVNTRLWMLQKF